MPRKLTQEEVQNRIDKKQDNQYLIIGKYINKDTPMLVKCRLCNIEWMVTPNIMFRHRIGYLCNHHISLNKKQVISKIAENNKNVEMIGSFNGASNKTSFQCKICKYIWEVSPTQIYNKNSSCPNCANQVPWDFDGLYREINILGNEQYILQSIPHGTHNLVKIHHKSCGYSFNMAPNNFVNQNQRCPLCMSSFGEQVIFHYLKSIDKKFVWQFKPNNLISVKPLSFDFFIDNNFIIENNGSQHYRQESFGRSYNDYDKYIKRDKIKSDYLEKESIPLFIIRYDKYERLPLYNIKNNVERDLKSILHGKTEPSPTGM